MRTIGRLLVIAVCVGSTSLWAVGGDLPGSGTEGDPYLIEDLADFDEFAGDPNYWDEYTRLETDVDLDDGRPPYTTAVIAPDTDNTNDPWPWPDGFDGPSFSGVFDGDGHVISNLTIDTAGADNDYLGLFGKISGSSQRLRIWAWKTSISPVGTIPGVSAACAEAMEVGQIPAAQSPTAIQAAR